VQAARRRRRGRTKSSGDLVEHHVQVPDHLPSARWSAPDLLPNYPRHKRAQPLTYVLGDFHRQHLGPVHLRVEELHDPLKLRRDAVRHEK